MGFTSSRKAPDRGTPSLLSSRKATGPWSASVLEGRKAGGPGCCLSWGFASDWGREGSECKTYLFSGRAPEMKHIFSGPKFWGVL